MTLPRIPSPAELLPAPPNPAEVEAQAARFVDLIVTALRRHPAEASTVVATAPVAELVVAAFREAGWHVGTHPNVDTPSLVVVAVSATPPIDPRLFK